MNKMEKLVIGVLGGMGTYATINMFKQYASVFPAEKEWERPRIVIDNRCTMPSRVRAYLYHEKVDELIDEMSESMKYLVDTGCNKIILACNTSHLFLPKIYEKVPELQEKIINIIDVTVNKIENDNVKEVFLIGSEGTIDSRIYQDALEKKGIKCLVPTKEEYVLVRELIEAVKQDNYTDNTEKEFLRLINRFDNVILGCTEMPILYERYQDKINNKGVYDPCLLSLEKMKEEYYD